MTITEALENCMAAAADAEEAVYAETPDNWTMAAVLEAQRAAYRYALPALTSRSACLACIACATYGLSQGYLDTNEVKTIIYAAQTALPIIPVRAPKATPVKRKVGFHA